MNTFLSYLLTDEPTLKTAEKDIICYIGFYKSNKDNSDLLLSGIEAKPIKQKRVKEGAVFEEKREWKKLQVNTYSDSLKFCYTEGFIHSHKSMFDAYYQLTKNIPGNKRLLFYQCIIPKGTKYIEGFKNCGMGECYASEKLIIKKEEELKQETIDAVEELFDAFSLDFKFD